MPEDTIQLLLKNHSEKIFTLYKAGVFDLDSGKAEINFNNGMIQNILLVNQTYKRDRKCDRILI